VHVRRVAVAEVIDESVDGAEHERDLERGRDREAAEDTAVSRPEPTRRLGGRILTVEPPLDRDVSRRFGGFADEQTLHGADHKEQLADDCGRESATGHGTVSSDHRLPTVAGGGQSITAESVKGDRERTEGSLPRT
jgi:hypothetical protein